MVQQGADVIIYFQPDTARREHGTFRKAARFACEFSSAEVCFPTMLTTWLFKHHLECPFLTCPHPGLAQDAADFLQSLEKVLEQFARAMLHISRGYALPEDDFQILSVSHGPASTARDPWKTQTGPAAEAVVSRAPRWNSEVPAPASWFPEQARTPANINAHSQFGIYSDLEC